MDKVYDMNSWDTIQIGDSDEQKNTLFVLDQFTMTETKEGWEKEPTGIFAFVLGFLRFSSILGNDCALFVKLPDWWESEEGYSEYFSGGGFYPNDISGKYTIERLRLNGCVDIQKLNVSVYSTIIAGRNNQCNVWCSDTLRNEIVQFGHITNNWWKPKSSIVNDVQTFMGKTEKVKVAVHVRCRQHWVPEPTEESYYSSFLMQVKSVIKKEGKDIVCYIGSDNKPSVMYMKNLLDNEGIESRIADCVERVESDNDWCSDGRTKKKYYGAVFDAVMFSNCDYYIGGSSNVGYYVLTLNKDLKILTPRILRKGICK